MDVIRRRLAEEASLALEEALFPPIFGASKSGSSAV
jgi:hypothetical protein